MVHTSTDYRRDDLEWKHQEIHPWRYSKTTEWMDRCRLQTQKRWQLRRHRQGMAGMAGNRLQILRGAVEAAGRVKPNQRRGAHLRGLKVEEVLLRNRRHLRRDSPKKSVKRRQPPSPNQRHRPQHSRRQKNQRERRLWPELRVEAHHHLRNRSPTICSGAY